jgi:hypothetical protein
MNLDEATKHVDLLERRYHDLHRFSKAKRLECAAASGTVSSEALLSAQLQLEQAELEKAVILREIAAIEDRLLTDPLSY